MLPCLRVKDGVLFTVIAPGGFAILAGLHAAADFLGHDLTITSACDGAHSGPNDPHHRGEAYDVRTHDLPDKKGALLEIQNQLHSDLFFSWIEDEGQDNEHIHCQIKKGTVYPPL
jgi:hypothetical protein